MLVFWAVCYRQFVRRQPSAGSRARERRRLRPARHPALWLLAVFFGLPACVILSSVNHRPTAAIELVSPLEESELGRGVTVRLRAQIGDEDDDELLLSWRVVLVASGGARFALAADGTVVALGEVAPELSRSEVLELVLPTSESLGGSYQAEVELVARDPRGAERRSTRMLVVPNRPPKIVMALTAGDAPAAGYPRHELLVATLAAVGDTEGTIDPDGPADLACGQAKTSWELVSPKLSGFVVWRVLPCAPGQTLDKLVWQLASGATPTEVKLRATVTDRYGAKASAERSFKVAADETPCISGAFPSFALVDKATVAKVALLSTRAAELTVASTRPLAPEQLHYRWLQAAAAAGPFTPVAGQQGPTLLLSASSLAPGEQRFFRVQVARDEAGLAAASCSVDQSLCASDASLPPGCYQWVTWEVTGR